MSAHCAFEEEPRLGYIHFIRLPHFLNKGVSAESSLRRNLAIERHHDGYIPVGFLANRQALSWLSQSLSDIHFRRIKVVCRAHFKSPSSLRPPSGSLVHAVQIKDHPKVSDKGELQNEMSDIHAPLEPGMGRRGFKNSSVSVPRTSMPLYARYCVKKRVYA